MTYGGEAAGLGAALLWSVTALFFAAAGRQIGSGTVNRLRITFAAVFLLVTLALTSTGPYPGWFSGGKAWYLALSGVIGLAAGDAALFRSLVLVGPRLTMLSLSLAPIFSALIAWAALGERLGTTAWAGILLTVGGVCWVVMEREDHAPDEHRRIRLTWLGLALVASICQSVGLILAKAGMGTGMRPLAATLIRMSSAAAVLWVVWLLTKKRGESPHLAGQPRALMLTLAGSIGGPYLGVWLSIVSVKLIEAGVAATLMATVPIWIIPWVRIVHKEKTSPRALVGTVIAVAGVALLMLR